MSSHNALCALDSWTVRESITMVDDEAGSARLRHCIAYFGTVRTYDRLALAPREANPAKKHFFLARARDDRPRR